MKKELTTADVAELLGLSERAVTDAAKVAGVGRLMWGLVFTPAEVEKLRRRRRRGRPKKKVEQ